MVRVMSGQELKDVRARSGMGTKELAKVLDESLSTVNRWLANGVRPEKEAKVRERLAPWLPPTEPDRYTQMSDAAVLAEIMRLLGIIGQRLAGREDTHLVSNQETSSEGHGITTVGEISPEDPTGSDINTESPAAAGGNDGDDDTNKIGPRIIHGRGPRRPRA